MGCQFGVPGGTYPPKIYPSAPPPPPGATCDLWFSDPGLISTLRLSVQFRFSLFSCLLAVPRPRRVAPDEAKWKTVGPTFIILWVLGKSLIPSKNMLLKVNWDKPIIGFSSAQRLESTNSFFVNFVVLVFRVEVETDRSSVRRKVRHSRGQGYPTTFFFKISVRRSKYC